jgi:transposase InsO family protein
MPATGSLRYLASIEPKNGAPAIAKTSPSAATRQAPAGAAYRHPDGNAHIERVFQTYKEEAVWPEDFQSFEEAKAELERWLIDYNEERPHVSLGDSTPAGARKTALTNK